MYGFLNVLKDKYIDNPYKNMKSNVMMWTNESFKNAS